MEEAASSVLSVSCDLIGNQNERIKLLEQGRDEKLLKMERKMKILEDAMKIE